jgi:uncharacterized membrane protein
MSSFHAALFLHLLGVLTVVSGIAVAAVAHASARRAGEVAAVAALLGAARTGVLLAAPGSLVLIGGGVWLVHLEHLPWDTDWLDHALVLFGVSLVLGAAGGRTPRQARVLAERLVAAGEPATPELRTLLDAPRARIANAASALAMLGVLWLMVAKPA